jgi:CpeT protein
MRRPPQRRRWLPTASFVVVALAAAVAASTAEPPVAGSADLDLLASWLRGSFSNAAQAEASNGQIVAVDLHLTPIWGDLPDGPWRYLEQAVSSSPDRPYRQRVLQLAEPVAGLLEIRVWALPDPTAAVGAWRLDEPLTELSPDGLVPRPGCSILLRRRGEIFEGSTVGFVCSSELRDASVATSEVAVTADGLVSWDRGYAADGRQVWGPTDGGLVFDRIVPSPEAGTETGTGAEAEAGTGAGTEAGTGTAPSPDGVSDGSASGGDQGQRQ